MRPRGEFRAALGQAFDQLATQGGATWREAAAVAGVGWDVAKYTARSMLDAGELAVVGEVCMPGVRRPMLRLKPVQPEPATASGADLEQAIRGWADFR